MKSKNSRLADFNAGLQQLARAAFEKAQTALINRALRQEKRKARMRQYAGSGNGARECARRRQQLAYDRGDADRRAIPKSY